MQKIFKNTAYFFLWIAMMAILVHGIIPHHHHEGMEEVHHACRQDPLLVYENRNCHGSENHLLSFHHKTENNEHCDECHFKTEFLYKQNIKVQDLGFSNLHFFSLPVKFEMIISLVFFSPDLYKKWLIDHSPSRGPPAIINALLGFTFSLWASA